MPTDNILDAIIAQTKLSKKETSKQQKVVEAAITMFAEKGYANTSTSEIAKAAGVSEGTIFRHYGTKENLLLAVVLPFLKESLPGLAEELLSEIAPQNFDKFENFLRAILKNRMAFLRANKEIFQVAVKEFMYHEALRKEILPYLSKGVGEHVNKVIDMFKARGELVDIPNKNLIRMIFTFMFSYFFMRFVLIPDDSPLNDEIEVEYMVSFITQGVKRQ